MSVTTFTPSISPEPRVGPGRWLPSAVVASAVALALMMRDADLSISLTDPGAWLFAFAFAILAVIRWRLRRPASRAARICRDAAEYFGLSTAISLVGAVASYPVAAFSHGFADAALRRSDQLLHFDWLTWYRVTAAHSLLQLAGRVAYAAIYVSPVLLLGYHAATDQRREAYRFMAAIWLSAALTLIGFWFMPAVGPFGYLWHKPIIYLPVSDLWQPDLIPKLRTHTLPPIKLGHLVGLVSAPSFHAAAAILLIAFGARQRAIRVPLVVANLAMLLATPVEGTHYLTDLLLGAIVAGISLIAFGPVRARKPSALPDRSRGIVAMAGADPVS